MINVEKSGAYAEQRLLNYNKTMTTTATAAQAGYLRRARLKDVVPLRTLFVHALKTDFTYFPPSYIREVKRQHTVPRLAASLLKKHRIVLLAMNENRINGYLVGSGHKDGVGEVYWLYVHPSQRGQRLGTRLLHESIKELKRQNMHTVRLMTRQYEQYYAKHGFAVSGTYTIHGLEVSIMELRLGGRDNG